MKLTLSIGLVAILAMIGTVAYQVNRTTWSATDRECYGLLTQQRAIDECRFDAQLRDLERQATRY